MDSLSVEELLVVLRYVDVEDLEALYNTSTKLRSSVKEGIKTGISYCFEKDNGEHCVQSFGEKFSDFVRGQNIDTLSYDALVITNISGKVPVIGVEIPSDLKFKKVVFCNFHQSSEHRYNIRAKEVEFYNCTICPVNFTFNQVDSPNIVSFKSCQINGHWSMFEHLEGFSEMYFSNCKFLDDMTRFNLRYESHLELVDCKIDIVLFETLFEQYGVKSMKLINCPNLCNEDVIYSTYDKFHCYDCVDDFLYGDEYRQGIL